MREICWGVSHGLRSMQYHIAERERFWVQLLGVKGDCARVILVLRECIWNAPAVSLVLPAYDDTGSLGFPRRQALYSPGSALGDWLPFPCREWGG